jgi:TonB family protein
VASAEVTTYFSPEGAIPATLIEHPVLWFPTTLRNSGVKGEVLAMFVVDSSGRVLDGSLKIVRSTDSLFTQSVSAVVAGMRFSPPQFNGKKIRQLVQQSFIFDQSSGPPAAPQARPTTDPTNRNPMPLKPIRAARR